MAEIRQGRVPVEGGRLYYRVLGEGPPIVVLHGGPDFDHSYLVPELDRLARSFRLLYYDQRGRGRSDPVDPEEVGIDSEVEDVDAVRRHFGLDRVAVLGHSWGGLLAMEYATRHRDRISHLILANTAPASGEDALEFRKQLRATRPAGDLERMSAIASSTAYEAGDLEAEADYYRLHFRVTLRRPELLELVIARLRAHFTPAGVLRARAIEDRLYEQTWNSDGYDLVPKLSALDLPALVAHAEHDFVPVALAARIADSMPCGELRVLAGCGHFAYLERPDAFHDLVSVFFEGAGRARRS